MPIASYAVFSAALNAFWFWKQEHVIAAHKILPSFFNVAFKFSLIMD